MINFHPTFAVPTYTQALVTETTTTTEKRKKDPADVASAGSQALVEVSVGDKILNWKKKVDTREILDEEEYISVR